MLKIAILGYGNIGRAAEEAVNWRKEAKKKCKNQGLVKACTAAMAGFLKTFVELNPDKQPDEIKLTVKCVGLD